jgi:hypothetical protein
MNPSSDLPEGLLDFNSPLWVETYLGLYSRWVFAFVIVIVLVHVIVLSFVCCSERSETIKIDEVGTKGHQRMDLNIPGKNKIE